MRFVEKCINQKVNLVTENNRKQGNQEIIRYFKSLVHWFGKGLYRRT